MSDHSVAADVVEPVTSRQPTSDDEEKAEEWTNYERLVRKLYMTNLFNPVKLGLENMDKLHGSIGSPMDRVRDPDDVQGQWLLSFRGCSHSLNKYAPIV